MINEELLEWVMLSEKGLYTTDSSKSDSFYSQLKNLRRFATVSLQRRARENQRERHSQDEGLRVGCAGCCPKPVLSNKSSRLS